MKRRLPVIALAAAMLVIGATAAVAAVNWPASCNGWSCANSHMNDLYGRLNTVNARVNELRSRLALTDPKTVVKEEPYEFDLTAPESIPFIQQMAACGTPDPSDDRPFYGYAISGGINFSGEGSEDWHIIGSGPPNMMNSWPVSAVNPDYVEGDPLPTVTTFAICLAI